MVRPHTAAAEQPECHPCTGLHTPICMQSFFCSVCCFPSLPLNYCPSYQNSIVGEGQRICKPRKARRFDLSRSLHDLTCGCFLYFCMDYGIKRRFHSRTVIFKEDIFQSCLLSSTTFCLCSSCFKPWVWLVRIRLLLLSCSFCGGKKKKEIYCRGFCPGRRNEGVKRYITFF